jgi:FtsZ-binding cell division protein ZapB
MELLEEKIRKATDLIRSLREDRTVLEEQLRSARDEVKRLSLKKDDLEASARLEKLQRERLVLGERIERMINIIEEVEAS